MIEVMGWVCVGFMAWLVLTGVIDSCGSLARWWREVTKTPWLEP